MVKDFVNEVERTMGVQMFIMAGFRDSAGTLLKSKYVSLSSTIVTFAEYFQTSDQAQEGKGFHRLLPLEGGHV